MVRDALSNYLTLASGLTEVTRQRARAAAKALVAQGGATVEQVSSLAEEVLQTSRANQTAMLNLVRYEIEHALARLGLATSEEVAALRKQVTDLERTVAALSAAAKAAPGEKAAPAPKTAPEKAAPAKKAGTAKKSSPAKKPAAPAKKATGKATAAGGAEG